MNDNVEHRRNHLTIWAERLAFAALIALLIIAALTMLDAILRWLGVVRIYGLHDLREFVFAVVVASCFPIGLLRGSAITVRLFTLLAGKKAGVSADRFAALLTLIFFATATLGLALLSVDFMQAGRTTSTLGWNLAPWIWAVTSAFALATCAQVIYARETWRKNETAL